MFWTKNNPIFQRPVSLTDPGVAYTGNRNGWGRGNPRKNARTLRWEWPSLETVPLDYQKLGRKERH